MAVKDLALLRRDIFKNKKADAFPREASASIIYFWAKHEACKPD